MKEEKSTRENSKIFEGEYIRVNITKDVPAAYELSKIAKILDGDDRLIRSVNLLISRIK